MNLNRKIKLFVLWPLLVLLILLALLRIALAPLVEYAIVDWFEQQGIESSVGDITFDFRSASLAVKDLHAGSEANPLLGVDEFTLDWSWQPLLDHRVQINEIGLQGIFINVERGPAPRLVIAGIELGGGEAKSAADEAPAKPLAWTIELGDLEIDDFKSCYRAPPQHDYCTGFDKLAWDGSVALDLARLDEDVLPLQAEGDFSLTKLKLQHNRLERLLLGFDRFGLDGVRVDGLAQIEIDTIGLDALALLERAGSNDSPQITRLEQLRASRLGLREMSRLEIAEVDLMGHEVILLKRQDGGFEFEDWLPGSAEIQPANRSEVTNGEAGAFSFAIGRFSYTTDRSIRYQDQSLEKVFVVDLNSIRLLLENLDSEKPEQPSRIEYSARYAEHGKLEINGTATPLADKPSFDLTGRIEGLDLRDLSAFTASAIGHRIKSGQLDADLKLMADMGRLGSEVDLTLNHFTLNAISAKDQEKLDSSLGFPLNASLSLLKDRDNRIQLNIPITGDLENPDFDPSDAITQAISTAITATVLNYYTPFGLVTLADGLFSLATALKFEPVVFPPEVSDLAQIDTGELDKIGTLMRERPGVHVTLCAFTNSADRTALFPDTAEIPADELELAGEQLERLAQLGEARAAGIKAYLAGQNIDPARLVLCDSEHAEGTGLAGVEISI